MCEPKTQIMSRASATKDLKTLTSPRQSEGWVDRKRNNPKFWLNMFFTSILLRTSEDVTLGTPTTMCFANPRCKILCSTRDIGTCTSRIHDKTMAFVHVAKRNSNYVKGFCKSRLVNINLTKNFRFPWADVFKSHWFYKGYLNKHVADAWSNHGVSACGKANLQLCQGLLQIKIWKHHFY